MDQATHEPTDSGPIDRAVIQQTIDRALVEGPPPPYEVLLELEDLLRGHIQQLLPAAEAAVGRLWRGGTAWWNAKTTLDAISEDVGRGLGEGLISAQKHVARLARHCRWLLARNPGEGGVQYCVECELPTGEPVSVGTAHSASGPGRTLYACSDCAPRVTPARDPLTAPH